MPVADPTARPDLSRDTLAPRLSAGRPPGSASRAMARAGLDSALPVAGPDEFGSLAGAPHQQTDGLAAASAPGGALATLVQRWQDGQAVVPAVGGGSVGIRPPGEGPERQHGNQRPTELAADPQAQRSLGESDAAFAARMARFLAREARRYGLSVDES